MKPTISRIAITTGLLLGSFAFAVLAADWSAPTVIPPSNNVPAPINVGGGDVGVTPYPQLKTGLLGLVDLVVKNITVTTTTPGQTIQKGDILTSSDTLGTAVWKTPAGGGGTVNGSSGTLDISSWPRAWYGASNTYGYNGRTMDKKAGPASSADDEGICPPKAIQVGFDRDGSNNITLYCAAPTNVDLPESFIPYTNW